MRRLLIALLLSTAAFAQSYDRLVETIRIWNYAKYLHPNATASGVDWDDAFLEAAPKVLAATSDHDFESAIAGMLAHLHDPATGIFSKTKLDAANRDQRRTWVTSRLDSGVLLLTLQPGTPENPVLTRAEILRAVGTSNSVLIDLRDSLTGGFFLPPLPAARPCNGVSLASRVHSGYASAERESMYHSSWELKPAAFVQIARRAPRYIFLINSKTNIPSNAVALQGCGAAAIVSEDAIDERQLDFITPPNARFVQVQVRLYTLFYSDGTAALHANVVLGKTGDEARNAAEKFALTPDWPAPDRPKYELPPAGYRDKDYPGAYPSREVRLLAAARVWGVFHYFHPYLPLYDRPWDTELAQSLPRIDAAANAREYHLAIAAMVAQTDDTHCFVSSPELSKFYGAAATPIRLDWIENQPVVVKVVDDDVAKQVAPGDVLVTIDGRPYQDRMKELEPYIAASTPQSMKRRIVDLLLNGAVGTPIRAAFRSEKGVEREVELQPNPSNAAKLNPARTGPVYRLLTPKIGYVDLERLPVAQVDAMFRMFQGTDAIIMDMRGYPQGTAWSIAPVLTDRTAPVAARFRRNVLRVDAPEQNEIETLFFEQRLPAFQGARYHGKTAMLIDSHAISQSEHSGLFYKTANGTTFIGSPTMGANGDVTSFTVPGGIFINFSGHDVRWPDDRQLQRVGLTPDIEAHPTIDGIRAGRDEILDRAVSFLQSGQ
jgi:C-terminal processing protease CtpA/Prc